MVKTIEINKAAQKILIKTSDEVNEKLEEGDVEVTQAAIIQNEIHERIHHIEKHIDFSNRKVKPADIIK